MIYVTIPFISGIDFNFGAELMDVEERRQMLNDVGDDVQPL